MSEIAIPGDVIDAAENVWIELEDADGIRECVLTIAVAILAERRAENERCAKVADEQWSDNGPSFGWNQCALKIATAIRNQKP